jgi:hypothetical protein
MPSKEAISFFVSSSDFFMSNPAGKCVFCGCTPLSKGHIWPDCFGRVLPQEKKAKYHEQRIGGFSTFDSKIQGPPKWVRTGTGPLSAKRLQNTCVACNGGWMSRLESSSLHAIKPLVLGQPFLFERINQYFVAGVLFLISMRIESTARQIKTIPHSDRVFLMNGFVPSSNWRIWIGRYAGKDLNEYTYRYTAHQG